VVANGRTGWYFRVLTPGTAPSGGPIELKARDPAGVTVAMTHRARLPGADRDLIARVAAVDALASNLRRDLLLTLDLPAA
jgi:MOSC domain-containing protein YiiM